MGRVVHLRSSRDGADVRSLTAELRGADLMISGQDLGPTVHRLMGSVEYEWATTVAAEHLPALVAALGGTPGEDVLDAVARFSGESAAEVEARIREHAVPHEFWSRDGD